ncbi:unnamed protein product [Prorocentrum cordatum]|uniref:Uncharacterized protein n=1 Tax=Prorocentrum cordatum TaxID=2364126 RepID=A0ABN9WWI4_9DINO|nr:unnamed protein product [Polarella glacialis]
MVRLHGKSVARDFRKWQRGLSHHPSFGMGQDEDLLMPFGDRQHEEKHRPAMGGTFFGAVGPQTVARARPARPGAADCERCGAPNCSNTAQPKLFSVAEKLH